jgi:hypothetical protein
MGWSNYIIIEDWKMIIETNREVGELENYIKESLDKMISSDTDIDVSISDLKVSDITIKDLCTMASAYENASSLASMEADKLFLYWLESRDIEYEIKSEFNLDLNQYKENGYKIIRRWKSDNINNDNKENNKENDQYNKEE